MPKFLFRTFVAGIAAFFSLSGFTSNPGEPTREELLKDVAEMEARAARYETDLAALKKKVEALEAAAPANLPQIVFGRLTPTASTPITIADTTNNTTIRFSPYQGSYVTLYYRGQWRLYRYTELSLALAGTAINTNYDVFIYPATGGIPTLVLGTAWSSATARAVALTTQDGVLVNSADTTQRYLGTIRTNGTANRFDDTATSRGIWNYYNRVPRTMYIYDGTNTWTYNTNTWREAGADVANDVPVLIGVDETLVRAMVKTNVRSNNNSNRNFSVGVGLDSFTANSGMLYGVTGNATGGTATQAWALYLGYPGIGMHTFSWNEISISAANCTIWGDNGATTPTRSGIQVTWDG